MVKLYEVSPKLKFVGLRELLLKIHRDLLVVHSYVKPYSAHYPDKLSNVEKMVLVLEDRRFLDHYGVDLRSVLRELLRAMKFQRHGGASTIDMQFVRTCTGYRERTIRRKVYEIFLSIIIQFRYSKIVILRSYLACAFFGSHLEGVEAVSRKLFGKNSAELSVEQASYVAAMLVYPMGLKTSDAWWSRLQRRAIYGKAVYVLNKESFDKLPV
ncbi:biosynthetic peptidoglycan transglycosylase [Ectopseudomonas mendocina]|uniref:biosynthetic peptidoglycan transglycosylase n=1 Tax=Ectopseudomonas mendocina TaxID=300 RepID=UPI00376F375A